MRNRLLLSGGDVLVRRFDIVVTVVGVEIKAIGTSTFSKQGGCDDGAPDIRRSA